MDTRPPLKLVSKVQRNQERHEMFLAEKRKAPAYVTATELLTDPKMKLTARGRRKLAKKRQVRYVSTVEPKSVHESIAEKVKSASMTGLIRLVSKSKSRIVKGQRVLADLAADSMLRPNVEREIGLETLINVAARMEYDRRTTAVPVKVAQNAITGGAR